jgi:hypothetical protein
MAFVFEVFLFYGELNIFFENHLRSKKARLAFLEPQNSKQFQITKSKSVNGALGCLGF